MANNKKHQQEGIHVHQLLTKTNAQDPLAGYHQQRQSLGKSKPSASGGRGQEKKIGLDRPDIAETIIQRHPPGPEMESPGQEKTREIKEHVENGNGGRRQADRSHMKKAGANRPGSRTMDGSR